MKSQSGFTLIEMIAVIIILAIMAATALPKFTNLSGEARLSALQGMQTAMNGVKTLAKSKWTVQNSANVNTIDMGGTPISVASGVGLSGYPALQGFPYSGGTSGMWGALDNPSGFISVVTAASGLVIWPAGAGTSANCNVWYSATRAGTGLVTLSVLPSGLAPSCL